MALFFSSFTHDLLLEAGGFLVSVKLIMMAYKASVTSEDIHCEREEIKELIKSGNGIFSQVGKKSDNPLLDYRLLTLL